MKRLPIHLFLNGGGRIARRLSDMRLWKRQQRTSRLIAQSALFDIGWYLQTYTDVAERGLDPALHYLETGWREGRDPGPHFSTNAYLRANGDVARSGANPLLHFLEFGYSEGRGTWDHRPGSRPVTSPGEPFGEAAPCLSVQVSDIPPVRWRRALQFDRAAEGALSVDGLLVGYVRDRAIRDAIEDSFAWLARVSGYPQDDLSPVGEVNPRDSRWVLLDAWYLDRGRLRTRWQSSEGPTVVRAFQHDPSRGGQLTMVGEGLASTSLDFIDVSLCNPFFPILFGLADPAGWVRGTVCLVFPSLCRGGLHYPELVSLARVDGGSSMIDILGQSQLLSEQLNLILQGEAAPFIDMLRADLSGADGSEPLFQPDFRVWLDQVARISIGERSSLVGESGQPYRPSNVGRVTNKLSRRGAGGTLVVAADMVPSLSALCALACASGQSGNRPLSLIVAEADVSQPATLFELPLTDTESVQPPVSGLRSTWPELIAGSTELDCPFAGAIRHRPARELEDVELLAPVSGTAFLSVPGPEPITWLIWPEDWNDDALGQSLEALSLSSGADTHVIALIGSTDTAKGKLAERLFPGRLRSFERGELAAEYIGTPLAGYLGSGVVFHDRKCPHLLSALMKRPGTITASCVIVSTEPRGKTFQTSVIDAGKFAGRSEDASTIQVGDVEVRRIWRAVYPVARPPRDLWIARSSSLGEWLGSNGNLPAAHDQHLCTSIVSASVLPKEGHRTTRVRPPALKDRALRSEALYG